MVMGILNITPDSFYTGHHGKPLEEIVSLAKKMVDDGADMLDIGGQSSRPGSERIDATTELERIKPVVSALRNLFPDMLLSVDTYHSLVAREVVQEGVDMINDISAGDMDPDMIPTVADLHVPYICMHMKGVPETMQQQAVYDDVLKEVLDYFIQKLEACRMAGINDVIIDPGFGFGKTIEHNFRLLKHLPVFQMLHKPVMVGLSRKSSIYKTLNISAGEALNGTTVMHTLALLHGASILRVHDVREAVEAVTLMEVYKKTAP